MLTIKRCMWWLIAATLLFKISNSLFYIDGYIAIPQFPHIDEVTSFEKAYAIIGNEGKYHWYLLSFLIDFVWAPLLLLTGYLTIRDLFKFPNKWIKWTFIVIAGSALVLDYWENLQYLKCLPFCGLWTVQLIKLICYGLAALIFVACWLKHLTYTQISNGESLLYRYMRAISMFLKSSYISLLIIVIVVLLLTLMGQGSVLIVDLMDRPYNLTGSLFLVFFLAVVVSHYPAYIEAGYMDSPSIKSWGITSFIIPVKWTGFGLVYYNKINDPFDHITRKLRHYLGNVFICAFLYILFYVGHRFFERFPFDGSSVILFFAFSIFLYEKINQNDGKYKRFYGLSFIITGGLIVITFLVSWWLQWSWVTLSLACLTTISMLISYVFFRVYRGRQIVGLGNPENLLRILATVGWLSLIPLIAANLSTTYAVGHLSPVVILMLYLVNFYGFIIIIYKHILYYNENKTVKFNFYSYVLPAIIIAIVSLVMVTNSNENDLHLLVRQPETQSLSFKEYCDSIPDKTPSGKPINTYFQVASYGGGLKANLWTLLVLNKLQNDTDQSFINATLSMSGISGGMHGLGNYGVLWANYHEEPSSISDKIYDIGRFNHLAIDLTFLFGKDLVREWIPSTSYEGTDRSFYAMKYYKKFSGLNQLLEKGDTEAFRSVWYRIHERSGHFPAIIVNSYSTSGKQGTAFSLSLPSESFSQAFPGAINMIDYFDGSNSTITYYDALSSSNRFPFFSPAARIEKKGHFLDGGYFDNSGLSTSISFGQYAFKNDTFRSRPVRHIVIDNHKNAYLIFSLQQKLRNDLRKIKIDENKIGEYEAILKGIVSLDKVPNYFEGKLGADESMDFDQEGNTSIHIHMPQPIKWEDIVDAFDGQPKIDINILRAFMEEENEKIKQALKAYDVYKYDQWGLVEPPLARLNSEPGVRYQEAMVMFHPHIKDQIDLIDGLIR
ncbi:MAG: hypothetical protein ACFHWX_06900 [Bacteroidota bacterium]